MHESTLPGFRAAPSAAAAAYPEAVMVPPASAVSWGAILAGAAGAAALALILLMLGVGLGLSSVSPWAGQGASATTFGVSTILWLSFTQLAAAGLGGYLAGRLRTRWVGTHRDEVYFRDTAHGFLAWAISILVTAALLTSAIGGIVNSGVQAGATVASGTAQAAASAMPALNGASKDDGQGYFVDGLFRKSAAAAPDQASGAPVAVQPNEAASAAAAPAQNAGHAYVEAGRIFASAVARGQLPADDAKYLGQLVSQHAGLPPAEAEKRVTDTFTRLQTSMQEAEAQARSAADTARKASAYGALWLFVSLLIGAFCASLAATFGGRQGDLF